MKIKSSPSFRKDTLTVTRKFHFIDKKLGFAYNYYVI